MSPVDDSPRAIARRIALARERAGLQQEELGTLLDVGDRQIRNYESGKTVPYHQLSAIANATGVSRDWLLTGDDDQVSIRELAQRLAEAEADREEMRQMMELLLEAIRPGWRGLLRPPAGLGPPHGDSPHSEEDPDERENLPEADEPPSS